MTDTQELERRVHEALRAKAAQIDALSAPHAAFDALHEPIVTPKRPRRALMAVATALAVAAATAGVVLVARPHQRGPLVETKRGAVTTPTPTTAAPSTPSPITAPLLAPTWVPDGQKLWSLTSESQSPLAESTQLFGTATPGGTLAPGLLVEIQPASPGSGVGDGTAVTVRGTSGVTRGSKDAGDAPFEINWIEGAADVRVTVRGATVAEAVSAIDGLRPRGSSLLAGFDAATNAAGYPLLGEHLTASTAPDVFATFEYSASEPSAGATPDFTVSTDTAGSYPGYLRTWMAGHLAPDGTAVAVDPVVGYSVAWPDGRFVVVAAHDPAVLQHIATSVAILDKNAAASLAAEAQARVAALPEQGSAVLDDGVVDLRGSSAPTAVCLHVGASPAACSNPFAINALGDPSSGALPDYAGSAVISGQWYVFVAANAEPSFSRNGVLGSALPAETGVIDGLHVALVVVPAGVDHVQVLVPTSENQSSGAGFQRPPS